jgi:hypothetical protein
MIQSLGPIAGLACVLLLTACDGREIVGPHGPVDVRPYVTGEAARALSPEGLFILPEPAAPSTRSIILPGQAVSLAASYVLSFGPALQRFWERDRGRSIRPSDLRPDRRAFYAATPYGTFPEGYHPGFSIAFGPYYLVQMRSGSTAEVLVAVAGYATEVAIDSSGYIDGPVQGGNEFVSQGVPLDTTRPNLAFSVTPEEAVFRAGQLTGARVSSVPQLLRVGLPLGPFSSVWKLTLDRTVRVTVVETGRKEEVSEIYVGFEVGRQLIIPATEQPTEFVGPAIRIDGDGEHLGVDMVSVPILPGLPTVFEAVAVR